jgi:hypothetical protein
MNVVIVAKPSRGSTPKLGCRPAATSTIIVSPTPRETPSTTDATMPEIAAGKTTFVATCRLVAPSPKAPSRSPCGTARIESSEIEAIVGTIMKPITRPAASALNTWISSPRMSCRMVGVTKLSAK